MRGPSLAIEADPIRGMVLSGEFDLFSTRRSEGRVTQCALRDSLDTVSQTVEAPEQSDEELVADLRNEDHDALDLLFSRHSRLVYSIALRILRDAGEAEEVVQECFLYVFRKAFTFEPSRGCAKVWIVQVAYSRARDRKAYLSRRGFYFGKNIDLDGLDGTLVGNADVERQIGAKVDCDRLQQAFEDLTEVQRKTLNLFYFEGLDLREISERLEETLGNVRHHFYRGLEHLRRSAITEAIRNHRNGKN
jgi:RNA polymerase sigma-70 factor (ECF subfamily)